MARRKEIEWLLNELPELTAKGVLSADAAERVRQYYAGAAGEQRSWLGIMLSAVGALLIGGGIISLLAYNWENFSRPLRAVIAYVPLLAALAGAFRVVSREGERNVAAREGWGLFWALAVGACLGLIAQTYHLGGRFDTFLLVWMLLVIPVAFVMRAAAAAVLAMAGCTAWAVLWDGAGGSGLWLWPLGAAATAAAWPLLRNESDAPRAAVVASAAAIMVFFAMALTLAPLERSNAFLSLAFLDAFAVAAALQLAGEIARGSRWEKVLASPRDMGAILIIVLCLTLSFWSMWKYGRLVSPFKVVTILKAAEPTQRVALGVLLFAAVAAWGAGCCWAIRRNHLSSLWLGSAPLVFVLAAAPENPLWGTVLMNAYLLAAGVAGMALGVREKRPRRAYAGLGVTVLVIGARFFDVDLGFIARGVIFILLGAAFIAAQRMLARRMREGV